jgi:hypothetical protein
MPKRKRQKFQSELEITVEAELVRICLWAVCASTGSSTAFPHKFIGLYNIRMLVHQEMYSCVTVMNTGRLTTRRPIYTRPVLKY